MGSGGAAVEPRVPGVLTITLKASGAFSKRPREHGHALFWFEAVRWYPRSACVSVVWTREACLLIAL